MDEMDYNKVFNEYENIYASILKRMYPAKNGLLHIQVQQPAWVQIFIMRLMLCWRSAGHHRCFIKIE